MESFTDSKWKDISSEPKRAKYILFIAEEVVTIKQISNFLDNTQKFADGTKKADGAMLWRGWTHTGIS